MQLTLVYCMLFITFSIVKLNTAILYEKRCHYRAKSIVPRIVAETKNILTTTYHKETFSCGNPITFFRCHRIIGISKYKQIIVYKIVNEVRYIWKPCCCSGERRDRITDNCEPICNQPCQNKGICIRPDTCSCKPQWEGKTCETDVNECEKTRDICAQNCTNLVPGYECSCRLGYKVDNTDPNLCVRHSVSVGKFVVEAESLTQVRISWKLDSTFELSQLLKEIKISFTAENRTSSVSSMDSNLQSLTVIGLEQNMLYTFSIDLVFHDSIPLGDRITLMGTKSVRFRTPSTLMSQCLTYHNKRQKEMSLSIISHQIDPNPCSNNGECLDHFISPHYTCNCPPGLTGDRCNEFIDPCANSDCKNGGTCIASSDRTNYTCSCPTLYTGRKCDVKISPCELYPDLCLNGASCLDRPLTDSGYECACATGFIGRHCEVSYTYCGDKICLNNGECKHNETSGLSTCECSLPYYGERCEITMESCVNIISSNGTLLNPCQSNGLCYQYPTDVELNEPFCACPTHAMGKFCELTCKDENSRFCDCNIDGTCI